MCHVLIMYCLTMLSLDQATARSQKNPKCPAKSRTNLVELLRSAITLSAELLSLRITDCHFSYQFYDLKLGFFVWSLLLIRYGGSHTLDIYHA